jgi:hypothetical protein
MTEKWKKSAKVQQETAKSCQYVQKTQKKRFLGLKLKDEGLKAYGERG